MSKDPFNFNFPFVNMMPEDMGDPNLMLSGMKMMSQAWQNFATMTPQAASAAIDPNELDKRIEELKAVESWLKLNLSMLTSTIHSLEIQKANMQNFSSFMEMMSEPLKASQAAAAEAAQKRQAAAEAKQTDTESEEIAETPVETTAATTESSEQSDEPQTASEETSKNQSGLADASAKMQDQALNWFNLLGDQFKNIVASVAASTPSDVTAKAETDNKSPVKKASKKAVKKSSATKKTAAKKAAAPSRASKAVKKVSKTTAAKKAPAKKSAAKKSVD
ncbi:MAG: hypothetical protein Q4G44_08805 [Alcaligenaceae bacterium]|nr:hypothetical protein [Alcaligenaceae bacterium]